MSTSVVALQITGDRERALEILAEAGERLGRGPIAPEGEGPVQLFFGIDYDDAYEQVRGALDATAEDWAEHIQLYHRSAS